MKVYKTAKLEILGSFTFYPTPEGATTRDDKRLKGKDYPLDATFRNNENIDLKLQDQFMLLHIDSLTSKSHTLLPWIVPLVLLL